MGKETINNIKRATFNPKEKKSRRVRLYEKR